MQGRGCPDRIWPVRIKSPSFLSVAARLKHRGTLRPQCRTAFGGFAALCAWSVAQSHGRTIATGGRGNQPFRLAAAKSARRCPRCGRSSAKPDRPGPNRELLSSSLARRHPWTAVPSTSVSVADQTPAARHGNWRGLLRPPLTDAVDAQQGVAHHPPREVAAKQQTERHARRP